VGRKNYSSRLSICMGFPKERNLRSGGAVSGAPRATRIAPLAGKLGRTRVVVRCKNDSRQNGSRSKAGPVWSVCFALPCSTDPSRLKGIGVMTTRARPQRCRRAKSHPPSACGCNLSWRRRRNLAPRECRECKCSAETRGDSVVRAKQFAWHLISEKPQLLEQIAKTGSLHEVAIRLTSYMKTVAPNHAMNEQNK
jgi:hypothetical protein